MKRRWSKKSMIRAGMVGILIMLVLFLLLMISRSSAFIDEKDYSQGDEVRIDLRGFDDYVLRIETPTKNLLKEGSNDSFLFRLDEVGGYVFSLRSGENSETHKINVVMKAEGDDGNLSERFKVSSKFDYSSEGFEELDGKSFEEGDRVRIDASKLGNYEANIKTPTENFSRVGSNDFFSLNLKAVGSYLIELWRGGGKREYRFEVTSAEETEEVSQISPEIGKSVRWELTLKNNTFELPVSRQDLSKFNIIDPGTGEAVNYTLVEDGNKTLVEVNASPEKLGEGFKLEYFTEAPKKEETVISEKIKKVKISAPDGLGYENVLAYTDINEFTSDKKRIRVYWEEGDEYVYFDALDTNGNGLLDRVRWVVPHLSEQTFEIIFVTKADHLDEDRNFIEDVYELVKERDGFFTGAIPSEHYIRVVFEKLLDNTKDITIYARSSDNASVEVYEKDSDVKIADFGIINVDGKYQIFLDSLSGEQDTFDLKVVNGSVDFDYVVDPVTATNLILNFTDSSSNTAYYLTNGNDNTVPPSWAYGWGGSEVSSGGYSNLATNNDAGFIVSATGINDNREVYARFNFTIPVNQSDINYIQVMMKQRETSPVPSAGAEHCYYYAANFNTNAWQAFGTEIDGTIYVTRTANTTNFANFINGDQLVLLSLGYAMDVGNSEGCDIDYVEVLINYNVTTNDPPTQATPVLNSSLGTNKTNENLTVYNQSTYDSDGAFVKNIINWYLNGSSFEALNMPFEGGSNSTFTKDYSGNNNDGGVSGATWSSTEGYDGFGAYYFDGGDRILIPDSPFLEPSTNLTVAFWMKRDGAQNQWAKLLWYGPNGVDPWGPYGFEFNDDSDTDLRFHVNCGGSQCNAQTSGLADSTWYFIVGTYDGVTTKIYLNGFLDNTDSTGSGAIGQYDGINGLALGDKYETGQTYIGWIDDLRIYNSTLSPEQVLALYNNRTDLIDSNETSVGDVWQACITPNDGVLDGDENCSNSLTVLPSIAPPLIQSTSCYDGSDWVENCTTIGWGQNIRVRTNCSSQTGGSVNNVTFTLTNIEDDYVYFNQTVTSKTGDWWEYDSGIVINDSGTFNMHTTCRENPTSEDDFNWTVDWGTLTVDLINPSSDKNVLRNDFFNFTSQINCVGGECGNVNATLDPPSTSSNLVDVIYTNETSFSSDTTVDLPASVNLSRSFLYGTYRGGTNTPANSHVRLYWVDDDTIGFDVSGTYSRTIRWWVVEFNENSNAYVQHVSTTLSSNPTDYNLASAVNLSSAWIIYNGKAHTGSTWGDDDAENVFFLDEDTVRFDMAANSGSAASAEVIWLPDSFVENLNTAGWSSTTETYDLSREFDMGRSIYLGTYEDASDQVPTNTGWYANLTNETRLQLVREGTSQLDNLHSFLVELPKSVKVQRKFVSVGSAETSVDVSIDEVNASNSIILGFGHAFGDLSTSGGTSTETDDAKDTSSFTMDFANSTAVTLTRQTAGGETSDIVFTVVEFGELIKDGAVSMTVGELPFYTTSQNPMDYLNTNCLEDMKNQSCNITWSVNATGSTNSVHEFYVLANSTNYTSEVAGGESSHINITITELDLSPPVVYDISPANGSTIQAIVTLSASTNENADCQYSTTGNFTYGAGTDFATTGGTAHSSFLGSLSDGAHTYYVKCNDTSGNYNSDANQNSTTFFIDGTPPEITINAPVDSSTFADVTPTLNITLSETVGALMYSTSLSGDINRTICTNCTGTYTVFLYLTEGEYTAYVYANDSLGNMGANTSTFTIDMNNNYYDSFDDNSSLTYEGASMSDVVWNIGNVSFTRNSIPVSLFEGFESGSQNTSLWDTYQSGGDARIRWNYGTSHGGSYSLAMDDNDNQGDNSLNVVYTNYDFSGAIGVYLDLWTMESGDEDHPASDHSGNQNSDGIFYTCDGTNWYVINNYLPESYTDGQWREITVNVTADSDFCGTLDENFAIKFSQYDNYPFDYDGIAWDDINITYYMPDYHGEFTAYNINTTQPITQISNISWNEDGTDATNTINVNLSVDGGATWYEATNNQGLSGFSAGSSLVYRAFFDTDSSSTISLLDMNITWENTVSPTPNITINAPVDSSTFADVTPTLNVTLDGTASELWYTTDGGATNITVCTICSGTQTAFMYLAEGDYTVDVYASNPIGAEKTNSSSFTINMNNNYYDGFEDSSSEGTSEGVSWNYGNFSFTQGYSVYSLFEGFESGSQNTSLWGTYQTPASDARIQWDYGTSHGGSYALAMDDNDGTGDASLNVIYTVWDFTGATDVYLSVWTADSGDESNPASDHSGNQNSDGIFYTCDGTNWYMIENYLPESHADNSWRRVTVNVTADPDFCGTLDSNFAIKFTQYDNYALTYDGIFWDDINITYLGPDYSGEFTAYNINTTQPIIQISNISWNEDGTDATNNITVNLSVDGGATWYEATNNQGLSGFSAGSSLIYKVFFNADSSSTISLLDMNITWAAPPTVNIVYPLNTTYDSNVVSLNYTVVVTGAALDSCWWTNDTGTTNYSITCGQNISTTSQEGANHWIVYANDTEGAVGYDSVIFNIDSSAPTIEFINQTDEEGLIVDETHGLPQGSNLTINVNVSDSNLDKVWVVVWETVKGGAEKARILFTYVAGTLWKAIIPTDATWDLFNYNYTIYANDTAGTTSEYDSNFTILNGDITLDLSPNPSPGYGNITASGHLNFSNSTVMSNYPINLWLNGELLLFNNLTGNGVYDNYQNFTDTDSSDFNDGKYYNVVTDGSNLELSGTNTSGNFTRILDAGAMVEWDSVVWNVAEDACSAVITYQDGDSNGFSGTTDSYINGDTGQTGTNYGTSQNLLIDGNPVQRALIKFDVLGYGDHKIPFGSTINSAEMTVTVYDPGNNPTVHEILEEWDESQVTYLNRLTGVSWSNPGCGGTPSRSSTEEDTLTLTAGNQTVDISNAFRRWNNETSENYGVMFEPVGSTGGGIRSSEYSSANERPKLSVDFSSTACSGAVVYVRTSNDKQNWGEWQGVSNGGQINDSNSASRYLEYRVELYAFNSSMNPSFQDIAVNYTAVVTDSSGDYSYDFISPTIFGTYPVVVNTSYKTFSVEATADLDVQSGVPPEVELIYPNGVWFSYGNLNLTYNASDANDDINGSVLIINGQSNATNSTPVNNGVYSNFTVDFGSGQYNWSVNVSDSTGYIVNSSTWTFYVDLEDPNITLLYPGDGNNYTVSILNMSFNVTDNLDSILDCNLTIDGGVVNSSILAGSGEITNVSSGLLTNGVHYWNVTCSDESGRSHTSDTWSFNITDTPPGVNLVWPENNYLDGTGNISFVFNVTDNSGLANCSLIINDSDYTLNQTPISNGMNNTINKTGLSEGDYNWTVECFDLSGSSDKPTSRDFSVDLYSPTIELNQPDNGDNSSTADVNFNFTANDTYDSLLDCNLTIDGIVEGSVNATAGDLTNSFITDLTDGLKYWNVTCADDAGHVNTSATRTINISEPPEVYLNTSNETSTQGNSIILEYTPFDNTNLSSCSFYLNGAFNRSNSSEVLNRQLNSFEIQDLSDGVYFWYMNCSDFIGLYSSSETRVFYIDNEAPNITSYYPDGDDVYAVNVTFNFTVEDKLDDELVCNITVGEEVKDTNFNATNGTVTNRTVSGITDGYHTWYVNCSDSAGNSAGSSIYNFTRYTNPDLTLIWPEDEHWFNVTSFNLTYFTEDDIGLENSTLIINGLANLTNQTPIANGANNNFTINGFAEGVYDWTVNASDASGLIGTDPTRRFYVDTTPPGVILNYPDGVGNVTTNNITFNFTVFDNLDSNISCELNVDGDVEFSGDVANASDSINYLVYFDGDHTWNVTCWDNASHYNYSDTINFTVKAPPNVTLDYPGPGYRTKDSDITFSYTPYDPIGFDNCSIYVDGQLNKTEPSPVKNQQNNITVNGISEGIHNWTVECFDVDENPYAPTARIFRRDISPPIIILEGPADGAGIDYNEGEIFFRWRAIDVLDNNLMCNLTVNGNFEEENQPVTSNITHSERVTTLGVGEYDWNVTCWDQIYNDNVSETRSFNLTYPDFTVENITFNSTTPYEGESVLINATIGNIGWASSSNVVVSFYKGDPSSGGESLENVTTSVGYNDTVSVTSEFTADIGDNDIFVVVDLDDDFTEFNESNNNLSETLVVGSWMYFYGNILSTSEYELRGNLSDKLIGWNASDFDSGNLFVTDYEATISWGDLIEIGKKTDGSNSSGDLSEIDSLLGMSGLTDSVYEVYNSANSTADFIVFGKNLAYVPIANSTNNSNFVTGILWDSYGDTDQEFGAVDEEDLVFAAKVNPDSIGAYGTYDYELRVPAKLREYDDTNSETVVFYVEIW